MEFPRRLARKLLPRRLRRWLRERVDDFPHRLRDLGPDLRERLTGALEDPPLPPAALRRRVGLTSSRAEFLALGRKLSEAVLSAFAAGRRPGGRYERWLDFGCGSGRVARFLIAANVGEVQGVDVDRPAIRWARRNLGPGFRCVAPCPPLPFSEDSFDVAYAVSVFTHMDESMQWDWLRELHRILRPRGLLIASTHNQDLQWTRPDLTDRDREMLAAEGFLFAPGAGLFNDNSTFHTLPYLEKTWGRLFVLQCHEHHGLAGYQDLSVWEAREASPAHFK